MSALAALTGMNGSHGASSPSPSPSSLPLPSPSLSPMATVTDTPSLSQKARSITPVMGSGTTAPAPSSSASPSSSAPSHSPATCTTPSAPPSSTSVVVLEELWIYPVKSCQGIRVAHWPLDPRTERLLLDRLFVVVDADRRALRQRVVPALCTVGTELDLENGTLRLTSPRMARPLDLPLPFRLERRTIATTATLTTAATTAAPTTTPTSTATADSTKSNHPHIPWLDIFDQPSPDEAGQQGKAEEVTHEKGREHQWILVPTLSSAADSALGRSAGRAGKGGGDTVNVCGSAICSATKLGHMEDQARQWLTECLGVVAS